MSKESSKLHKEAINLFRREKYDVALEKLEAALAATDDDKDAAEIYNDVGVVNKQRKDYAAAHAALDQAMSRFTTLEDVKGQAQTLGNRAAVQEAQGDMEEAVETYKQSAKLLEAIGESDMAMYTWQAVSRLRMKQKKYIAAIGAYEEGVDNMPQRSIKRKVLEKLLGAPGKLLGGAGGGYVQKKDDDDSA